MRLTEKAYLSSWGFIWKSCVRLFGTQKVIRKENSKEKWKKLKNRFKLIKLILHHFICLSLLYKDLRNLNIYIYNFEEFYYIFYHNSKHGKIIYLNIFVFLLGPFGFQMECKGTSYTIIYSLAQILTHMHAPDPLSSYFLHVSWNIDVYDAFVGLQENASPYLML